ncbi:MAG: hypothetical protein KBD48_03535 [Candidatus Pacebacteria bacterium]|nr:hypothetical protein [Candidatus Paceibacterota bacterium]MBP9716231.1 hypothetical protein [Candidatus Paceibacterota bacterium]
MNKITFFMLRNKKILAVAYLFVLMILPFAFSHAVDPAGVNLDVRIKNPLDSSINTLPKFIEEALKIVLQIGVPVVTLAIIYSGFLFVMARGNSEKLGEAKNTLMYTLIGAALLLGSWVIAQAIQGTISDIKSTT